MQVDAAMPFGLVAAVLLLGACGGSATHPVAGAVPALPVGALSTLMPQPGEVPAGLILEAVQSGPATIDRLAGFSTDKTAATKTKLQADGFADAYVAEYASSGGRTLTVVVSRFATPTGAGRDLNGDLSGTTKIPGLGNESGEKVQPLPGGPATGRLVTERFRVGTLTYLVAVGGPQGVDAADVRSVALQLAARGRKA